MSDLTKISLYSLFSEHKKGLQFQGKFLNNLVEIIDNIFLYLRATWQQLWQKRLVELDNFVCKFVKVFLGKL